MREIEDKDLVGKTVKSINKSSVNMLRLDFTDGTSLELWAEEAVYTPMGTIPGIFADDPDTQNVNG